MDAAGRPGYGSHYRSGTLLESPVRGIGSGLISFRVRADRIADELVAGLRPRETEAAIARRSGLPDFHRHPAISDGFCFAEIRQIRT